MPGNITNTIFVRLPEIPDEDVCELHKKNCVINHISKQMV